MKLPRVMCVNQQKIFTPYLRRPIYVPCGHCPACQQAKAFKRVGRINNNYKDGEVTLMVSLTYARDAAPYVDRSEAYQFVNGELDTLNVYRDCSFRKVRKPKDGNDYNQVYKKFVGKRIINKIDFIDNSTLQNTKDLKHQFEKIGVCQYKDYQGFLARLRLNLKRHYKYDKKFSVYACSEYGIRSLRPHFHLLIFCKNTDTALMQSAIYESWPFSDLRKFPKSVQVAYRGASYVSSYVNCADKFPKFFKDYFRPKHSYSKGFGTSNINFSLSKILEKFNRGNMSFSVAKNRQGIFETVDVPIPAYVIHRFFPKFKGYTRVPPASLRSHMRRIARFDYESEFRPDCLGRMVEHAVLPFLCDSEIYKANICLTNAWHRCIEEMPEVFGDKDFSFYADMHVRVWNTWKSTLLRLHLLNKEIPDNEKYDNLDEVLANGIPHVGLNLHNCETDPNRFKSTIRRTQDLTDYFHKHIKHRMVANSVYLQDIECEL